MYLIHIDFSRMNMYRFLDEMQIAQTTDMKFNDNLISTMYLLLWLITKKGFV